MMDNITIYPLFYKDELIAIYKDRIIACNDCELLNYLDKEATERYRVQAWELLSGSLEDDIRLEMEIKYGEENDESTS